MIEFKNISFRYKGRENPVLENFNLHIKQGEVVVICGESGCGKTTVSRLINGLIPHYHEGVLTGEILINGHNAIQRPLYETARSVGSVFQNPRTQFFNVDTTSEIAFGCENLGYPPEEISRRIEKTVADFRIIPLLGRNIFNLSGGEKQKIACASVAACMPEILILDEPSSNLDILSVYDLQNLISFWKAAQKTIVIVEHRLYYLRAIADRIVYMHSGHVEEEFSPEELESKGETFLHERGLRTLSPEKLQNVSESPVSNEKLLFDHLIFGYKKKYPILNIPKLYIPKYGIIALIGFNGAGKSTLAKLLCGLEGKYKKRQLPHFKSYMVMQDVNHQLFTESVLDEVLLSMEQKDSSQAEEILQGLNLLSFKNCHPMSLSGGQKQRVAIASAIASKSNILLFDEPTSGLDYKQMKTVSRTLMTLHEQKKTLIVITHDLELILQCCDFVVHIENGSLREQYPLNGNLELLRSFFNRKDSLPQKSNGETI